jgi:Mrp family chromosome partitioning ATPase/capsular polysaccharide biosynthesis protein
MAASIGTGSDRSTSATRADNPYAGTPTVLPEPAQMTLRDYLVPVRERWWLILGIVVAITAAVCVYAGHRTRSYTAATKVFIGQNTASAASVAQLGSQLGIEDQTQLLTTNEVAAVVARKLGYTGSAAALAGSVSAAPETNSNFVDISATEGTSVFAARVANAFAQEFIARNSTSQISANDAQIAGLHKQIKSLQGPSNAAQRASLQSQIQELKLANSLAAGSATQFDVATPPGPNSGHSVVEYGALAALASLLGSVLLAYMLHRLDPRLKQVAEASSIYAHPVLATVSHDPEIDYFSDALPGLSDRSREAFRDLRVSLDLASPGPHFSTILVTSAGSGEGKTTVARNLAIALAEAGRRTAVIDADLRKASLAERFGVDRRPGLTDVLAGSTADAAGMRQVEIAMIKTPGLEPMLERLGAVQNGSGFAAPTVTVIPAGSPHPNPPAVLESAAFRELLHRVSERHDVVIIDSSPVTAVSDAMPIMPHVNAIVLVARNDITDRRSARRAADLISRVPGAHVVGVVVNDVPATEAAAYGVGYRYGYGYDSRDDVTATA